MLLMYIAIILCFISVNFWVVTAIIPAENNNGVTTSNMAQWAHWNWPNYKLEFKYFIIYRVWWRTCWKGSTWSTKMPSGASSGNAIPSTRFVICLSARQTLWFVALTFSRHSFGRQIYVRNISCPDNAWYKTDRPLLWMWCSFHTFQKKKLTSLLIEMRMNVKYTVLS